MAIFHLSLKTFSRTSSPPPLGKDPLGGAKLTSSQRRGVQSAVAAAAYRSAERLRDERTGVLYDFRRKRGVVHKEIFAPEGAPDWINNRQELWARAESTETRKNSTVAREFEIAIPANLTEAIRLELVRKFCIELVERHRFALDVSIHLPSRMQPKESEDQRNYHAHILTTTRRISHDGFTEKCRELDDQKSGEVQHWRKRWEVLVNSALEQAGHSEEKVDCRSHAARGLEDLPTIKVGRNRTSEARKAYNAEVRKLNREIRQLQHARAVYIAQRDGREQERLEKLAQAKARLKERIALGLAVTPAELARATGASVDPGDWPARGPTSRPKRRAISGHTPTPSVSMMLNLKGPANMDSVALRNALLCAVAVAKIPQDISLILDREGISTEFVRSDTDDDIAELNMQDPHEGNWFPSHLLGADQAWASIAARKGWSVTVSTGLLSGSLAMQPSAVRLPNVIENELDLLAEQISLLVQALRLLIIKIVNLFLRFTEQTFGAVLPRLEESPIGVRRSQQVVAAAKPPSAACVHHTVQHLHTLRDGIQSRQPDRILLPRGVQGMPELSQALTALRLEESKPPEQKQAEQQNNLLVQIKQVSKLLSSSRREQSDLNSSLYNYMLNKPKFKSEADRKVALVSVNAKVAEAEKLLDRLENKLRLLDHEAANDERFTHVERPQG